MSIQISNLHEHDLSYSVFHSLVNDPNYKYVMKGWFALKKGESVVLKENYYIDMYCQTCSYIYSSDKSIKALTTDYPHNLFFKENYTKEPYSWENKKIEVDKKYYIAEYFLVNKDYKDTMVVGYEKEIRRYLFSEINRLKKINKNLLNGENTSNNESEYDVVLSVDSIKNLATNGWEIKYKKKGGKELYEKQFKNAETLVVGVVGNGNKGKSFLLKKLSDYKVPMGYNVKTEGLSIIYRKQESKNLTILDSAGQETPLLVQSKNGNNKDKNKDNNKDYNKDKNKENDEDGMEFEEYSRDKLVTELYIQQFILWKSNIVILLVGSITLSEQKLYARVKSELLALKENQKINKKLFVVHNLQNFYRKEDVKNYIDNVLKKLYNIELKEIKMFKDEKNNINKGFDKFFLEINKDNMEIIHLLLINDYCDDSKLFNYNSIKFLKGTIEHETGRQTFPILENSKQFLLEISEQIMEKKLSENDIEIIPNKLIVKNIKEIQLKRFVVDEMGITKNDDTTVKYSYYLDPDKSKFIVNFELPGGGYLKEPIVGPVDKYFSFRFEGEINGELSPKFKDDENEQKEEKVYEELSKEKLDKIEHYKNLRKKHPIHINFKVSNQIFQLRYDDQDKPEYTVENTKKGIIIYIFNVALIKPGKNSEGITHF